MEKNILIIDDDLKLQELLTEYLEGFGLTVSTLPDGNDACRVVRDTTPDLIILDVMMPGKDGMDVLRDIRTESRTPVIMLTAKGDDLDRILGLELGADDYMPKPFNPRELLARMKAIFRRLDPPPAPAKDAILRCAGLTLDPSRRLLTVDEEEITLPPTECNLLSEFMRNPDAPLSRDDLMDRVWGKSFVAYDRSIDVYISKLRSVLKKHEQHADRIQTVWGTGYRFRSQI